MNKIYSEYDRTLIRNNELKHAEQQLVTMLLDGLNSGPAIPADKTYWQNKREALKQRHSAQGGLDVRRQPLPKVDTRNRTS